MEGGGGAASTCVIQVKGGGDCSSAASQRLLCSPVAEADVAILMVSCGYTWNGFFLKKMLRLSSIFMTRSKNGAFGALPLWARLPQPVSFVDETLLLLLLVMLTFLLLFPHHHMPPMDQGQDQVRQ